MTGAAHVAASLALLLAAGQQMAQGQDPIASDQERSTHLQLDFGPGWQERWIEARLAARVNRFSLVEEGDGSALRADSDRSASALWYAVDLSPDEVGSVSWRWKIAGPIPDNGREREKRGDDYAARFFVTFDGEPFSRSARALCYVWASREPIGAVFRNPYFDDVQTIVLESGATLAGEWVSEQRDFLSDYRAAFGERPSSVSAIAVMVDTDNTGSSATAWFGDIRLNPD